MGGMHTMGHMANLAADSDGVYLAAGGRLVVYDHDLNEQRARTLQAGQPEEEEEGARPRRGRMMPRR
jgi:hypothetical protein